VTAHAGAARRSLYLLASLGLLGSTAACDRARAQSPAPDTLIVRSGGLALRALLWRPIGRGPFPAVLFNHGSYGSADLLPPADPNAVGPVFASHGYVFMFPFRRGIGLSGDQGTADGDLMDSAMASYGPALRNQVQLGLLEGEELTETLAALEVLRRQPEVNRHLVAVAGHSFGGSLALLMAERDSTLRAVLVFAGAAASWDRSPSLRARLRAAVARTVARIFLVYAANDYSITPGRELAAELGRLGRPYQLKIYPATGGTARDGHNMVYRRVRAWEHDVFAFLDASLKR
jgi:dienelactone hydrolase